MSSDSLATTSEMDKTKFMFSSAVLFPNSEEASDISKAQTDLYSYLFQVFKYLEYKNSMNITDLDFLMGQIHETVGYFTKNYSSDTDTIEILQVQSMRLLGKVYTKLFAHYMENSSDKVSIGLIELTNRCLDPLTDGLKKLSMRSNWYSTIKHLNIVILQLLFSKFKGFLNSFKSTTLTTLYKYLKKCTDNYNSSVENSTFKANYFNDMMLLIDIILMNDSSGTNILDSKLYNRLLKISKIVTTKKPNIDNFLVKEGYVYPIQSVTFANNFLVSLLKSDKFVLSIKSKKDSSKDGSLYLQALAPHLSILREASSSNYAHLRLASSKNIADLLCFYYITFVIPNKSSDISSNSLSACLNVIFDAYTAISSDIRTKVSQLEVFVQFISSLNIYHRTKVVSSDGINFVASTSYAIINFILNKLFLSTPSVSKDGSKLNVVINEKSDYNDALMTLTHLGYVYDAIIAQIDCDANCLLLLTRLVSNEALFATSNVYLLCTLLDFVKKSIVSLDQFVLSHQELEGSESFDLVKLLSEKLYKLSDSTNFYVRVSACETLLKLIQIKPELSFDILNTSFEQLSTSLESNENEGSLILNENHGRAFIISTILTNLREKDYISTDFVLKTLSLALGYLKNFNSSVVVNNIFGSSSASFISDFGYERQLVSWILMIGLFNYASNGSDTQSNMLLLDNSNYMSFWKNLLAHNIPSNFVKIDSTNKITNLNEIKKLLEIKNLALTSLLAYITFLTSCKATDAIHNLKNSDETTLLSPDLSKKINMILNKSFTFITYLETQLYDFVLDSHVKQQIILNKLRILQSYCKLLPFLNIRNEFNSSIMLQIVKNFSDSSLYDYELNLSEFNSVKDLKRATKVGAEFDELSIFRMNDGLTFGLTSKLNRFQVEDLMVKATQFANISADNEVDFKRLNIKSSLESRNVKSFFNPLTVFDETFETFVYRPIHHSLLNDYLLLLYNGSENIGYSESEQYAPSVDTMVVDVSIELFASIFPSLSFKIQQSVLDSLSSQLRIEGSKISPRKRVVYFNTAVTLHSMLSYAEKNKLLLPLTTVCSIVECIKTLNKLTSSLVFLNSESVGLACGALERTTENTKFILEQVDIIVNSIVQDNNPIARSFAVLSLSTIFKHNNFINAKGILDVVYTLVMDPHPGLRQASIDALINILESYPQLELNINFVKMAISKLLLIWVKDDLADSCSSTIFSNLSFTLINNPYPSSIKLLRTIINVLGPNISSLNAQIQELVQQLILSFMYFTTYDYAHISQEMLILLEELSIYDKQLIEGFVYVKFLKFVLVNNFMVGVYNFNSVTLTLDDNEDLNTNSELYPVSTSLRVWKLAIYSTLQFYKLHINNLESSRKLIDSKFKNLIIIALENSPENSSLQSLFQLWFHNGLSFYGENEAMSQKQMWFEKLFELFHMTKTELQNELLEIFRKRIKNAGVYYESKNVALRGKRTGQILAKNSSLSRLSTNTEISDDNDEEEQNDDNETDDEEEAQEALAGTGNTEEAPKDSTLGSKRLMDSGDESLNIIEDEDTNWKFKHFILKQFIVFISLARNDSRLKTFLAQRISDVMRISFVASTSNIMNLRLTGMSLLGDIIDIFASFKDPLYPEMSILDQQQAQLISSIVPAFSSDSCVPLACDAVIIASKLISCNILPVSRLQRITRVLTTALEDFSTFDPNAGETQGHIKIGSVLIPSAKTQLKMKLAVLNAWAHLKINLQSDDVELSELISKYIDILVPMWIYSLREYSLLAYGSKFTSDSHQASSKLLYEESWPNFLEVIGIVVHEDQSVLLDFLGDDSENFLFVIFAEGIETLVKGSANASTPNQPLSPECVKVLRSFHHIFKLKPLSALLANDSVFIEFIDLFYRLLLILNHESKVLILDVLESINLDSFHDPDKLFELLRLSYLPVIQILPFVSEKTIEREKLGPFSDKDLTLLKKSFSLLHKLISHLPEMIQIDLLSSMLYVISLCFELNNTDIISVTLPLLKLVVVSLNSKGRSDILIKFYNEIKPGLLSNKHSTLIRMILLSAEGTFFFTNEDCEVFAQDLCKSLISKQQLTFTTQFVRNVVKQATAGNVDGAKNIVRKLLPALISLLKNNLRKNDSDKIEDPRLILEIFIVFTKQLTDEDNLKSALGLTLPLILWVDDKVGDDDVKVRNYCHSKLLDLIQFNPALFKDLVNTLSEEEKEKTEKLVKLRVNNDWSSDTDEQESHIELKQFG
ncbi:AP-1 accessory protein 1 [Komagataella phaffii CBS 7435]|nr:GQ67_01320T0 [Komagataella phaffii]AOA67339.1 GQ68_00070T0 [Komagataella phaffii GS115]CAH2447540.1 AP-1 accessory protein 1 [Komagataella phaffii CBS 7435]CCA37733.1 AP-1 accessory protein 1 [Komagataella phaffii CBS 7435]